MRRWIWMLGALILLALLPSEGTELGQLRPAAVLVVREETPEIVLETDTGDSGRGETLALALEDLRQTTPGHLFLDTVEDLIVSGETQILLPELQKILRPAVRVCKAEQVNLETVWDYLHTHPPTAVLSELDSKVRLQELTWKEERYNLEKGGSNW